MAAHHHIKVLDRGEVPYDSENKPSTSLTKKHSIHKPSHGLILSCSSTLFFTIIKPSAVAVVVYFVIRMLQRLLMFT